MKSILWDKEECAVCGALYGLESHHVIHGIANRKIADREGLIVLLCAEHHRGNTGVHMDAKLDMSFKKQAQRIWQEVNQKSEEDFRELFGKSYL